MWSEGWAGRDLDRDPDLEKPPTGPPLPPRPWCVVDCKRVEGFRSGLGKCAGKLEHCFLNPLKMLTASHGNRKYYFAVMAITHARYDTGLGYDSY